MIYSEDTIRDTVRRILLRTLGPGGVTASSDSPGTGSQQGRAGPAASARRPSVTEADVLQVPAGSQLSVPVDAVVTPLARDTALERRVELIPEGAPVLSRSEYEGDRDINIRAGSGRRTIALGADHGGFPMKEDLKTFLAGSGYEVTDCGTYSTASVDYPDFAYAVARLVADGHAWRGIIVDGAGIGSCMAANKVPGVRAAMCYDHATAANSREHNDANVLTLGGMLVGHELARQIVKTWLETDFGGGRHARRVDKIMGIERRFLR